MSNTTDDKYVLNLRRFKIEKLETKIEMSVAARSDFSYYQYITGEDNIYSEDRIHEFINKLIGYLDIPYIKTDEAVTNWLRSYLYVNLLGSIYYYEDKALSERRQVSAQWFQLYSFIFNCTVDICPDYKYDPELPDNRICFETVVFSNYFHSTIFRFPGEKKLFMESEYQSHYANVTRLEINGSSIGYADDYTLPDHPSELRNKVKRMINCFCDEQGLSPYISDDDYERMFIGLNTLLKNIS